MIYCNTQKGIFLERPNRFVAYACINGKTELCHVKNTGRCRELLVPGAEVILVPSDNPGRKTGFDLVSVYKGSRLINIDSQAPNRVFREFLENRSPFGMLRTLRPETKFGSSRFDFYFETEKEKIFAEIKGVTLEDEGRVLFPDAPTARGVKHLYELCSAAVKGFRAYAVFVVQMENVRYFTPNTETDPEFTEALRYAAGHGVELLAYDCHISENSLSINSPVDIVL